MPNINDLPDAVLAQILFKAAATPAKKLSEWKTKLPLLAVCRAWTKLATGAVFNQVYVEPPDSLDTSILWTSNTDLFISRGSILTARRLTIEWVNEVTPNHVHSIAKDILKLDRIDWQRINTLTITKAARTYRRSIGPVSRNEMNVTDVMCIEQYFAQNLRNIVELNLFHPNYGVTEKYLYDFLVSHYSGRLQVLRANCPIPFPVTYIARNINVLELTLDSAAARHLPSICGETLRVLKLEGVPRNFAWHHFRYDVFVQPIVFRQLTVLHLAFAPKERGKVSTKSEILDKEESGAHNCDQLVFPALRELAIDNCTPDCDLLYAGLPFPELKSVNIFGTINSIRHCNRLKLTWVRDLHVSILISTSSDTVDIYRATNHFFSDICIGGTATLIIAGKWDIADPEQMCWANLTNVHVGEVDYITVCGAIGRLPNLCEMIIFHLKFHIMTSDGFSTGAPLFVSANPMMAWGEKLAALTIRGFSGVQPITLCIGGIQALIINAGALIKLAVPKSARQDIARFIDKYKDCHPHLANISVC
ncbi:hypothetical protein FBU31_000391 [Coemansia sp. 'formosensis']|nr:hypothetical protein FBU31_000391 [Coemansia sp. 'formosensis']